MKPLVQKFQKHDLYTKEDNHMDLSELAAYYKELVYEFFGDHEYNFWFGFMSALVVDAIGW